MLLNILVVDGNSNTREALQTLIECDGHNVMVARDGATALALIQQSPVSVVLIDEDLRDFRGVDLALHIKTAMATLFSGYQCIVICIQGQLYPAQRSEFPGVDYILSKPAGYSEFRSLLSLCDTKLRNNSIKSSPPLAMY